MVDYNQASKDRFTDPGTVFRHELTKIYDSKARATVIAMLKVAPEEFWYAPSAFSGRNHEPVEFDMGGQVMHTRRVFRSLMVILDGRAEHFGDREMDEMLCAALIHDTLAGSTGSSDHVSTILEYYGANLDESVKGYKWWEGICEVAQHHMGRWSPKGLKPESEAEWALHEADMQATKNNGMPILKEHDYNIQAVK